ncbi:MAG: TRAP transporter substrate-binding protein DctP [Rhodospirillaceae bacterium]|jgi:TRAP-type C4-dicarboxylate transport system substrate-binding protein|nr:TRAP transporter substrate-binding protein DctP [Rhodospirillaceae bacterium]MBT5810448.1 TRAP transporter substrate-binding protein DctP [Rhodospirillaceae bacterium]
MRFMNQRQLRRYGIAAAILGVAAVGATTPTVAAEVKPVTIRFASDLTGPPHPAAIAKEYFRELIEKRIPGSKVRTYYAGALYNIPEAVEAMTEGNLEMAWGQFGKSGQVDPFLNVVVGPMIMSTPGAINDLDNFETIKMLKARLAKVHDVKMFATAHMSMFMGAGASFRLLKLEDFKGKKIRSMGPAENSALKAWGANPTTMAFGDVPPALQTGVIDGLLTSLGGFNATKDQAPFYSIAGINGIVGDYYWIGASGKWWRSLDSKQQAVIENTLVNDVIPFEKKMNWCNDKRLLDKYQTKDSTKPGIYVMNAAEQKVLSDKLGDATTNWLKENTPSDANMWIDKFRSEAKVSVAAHPIGSDALESTDCSTMQSWFNRYKRIKKKKKK